MRATAGANNRRFTREAYHELEYPAITEPFVASGRPDAGESVTVPRAQDRPCRAQRQRCNTDHHGVALVGGAPRSGHSTLNHFAFEVGTLDEVFRARAWLRKNGVPIHFEGRRRAGCQIAVEFKDPDGNNLEIYWGLDQVGTGGDVRPASEWRQALTLEDAVANPVAGQRLPAVSTGD
ncbi:MAG: hypothetical protein DMD90_02260 [Candidatus Rokuibacteriota bacterium]|nr:MAG: hypothetical protein DMD90_02260 [Candidatus Rokubacteria bacterium]